ncbi:MAG: inner rane transporter permease protein yddQ [Chloroflexi bacterium]|jgi:peptide/nickel transport system permease protein|nr:inner rane transporter permease protein yddQ [Chloroflexota bacterium]MDB5073942.1 inner rane transporter permease protein yddQ [Chloroflexota bacterium]
MAIELVEPAAGAEVLPDLVRQRSPWAAIRRNPLMLVGVVLLAGLLVLAIFAPLIARYDPTAMDLGHRLLGPSLSHPFGTDDGGRDLFSRVLYGARLSLGAAAVVIALAAAIGCLIGAVSGYVGGITDELLMRITDMFLAFPALVLAMALAAALGPSLINAMVAVAVVWWPWYARLMRGQILSYKRREFVAAARAMGAGHLRIIVRHLMPNCFQPIVVQATVDAGYAILTTASLSFIGVGAQPPTPEWGSMVNTGHTYFLDHWWYATFPGVAIFLTVMAFNLIGDGVLDVLDPRAH